MIQTIEKPQKVALCRMCMGRGVVGRADLQQDLFHETCPQCEGSGRVTVSAKMTFDIRPYRSKYKQ